MTVQSLFNHCSTFTSLFNNCSITVQSLLNYYIYNRYLFIVTPHAQRERGKVIGRGVHIYIYINICLWSKKKFESYFRDRLTFSNVDSRTSR